MKRVRISTPVLHSLPEHSNLLGLMALSMCFVAASLSGMLGLSAALGLERMIITNDGCKYLVAVFALTLLVSPIWLGLARKLEAVRKPKPKMS